MPVGRMGSYRQRAPWMLMAVGLVATLATCEMIGLDNPATPCGNGVCPPGRICVQGVCLSAECGNGIQSPAEACDDGNPWSHDGCTSRCVPEALEWVERALATPAALTSHALAYDAARGRIVLFGGIHDDDYQDQTWQWNGTDWSPLVPTKSTPPPRVNHALAYDVKRDRIVLFGGRGASDEVLDDIWEWDGMDWAQIFPGAGDDPGPSAREGHAMAYDAGRGRVVLFGGQDSDGRRGDTWAWDGTAWTEVAGGGPDSGESPSARDGHAMTYDATRDRVVLFGGYDGAARNDTWLWNGTTWAKLDSDSGAAPAARSGHAMAYDGRRARTIVFGGVNADGGDVGATWALDDMGWNIVAAELPPARSEHAIAYDAARDQLVLFGGFDGTALGDTWWWDGTLWTQAAVASAAPVVREEHAMAHDAGRGRLVLFGGYVQGTTTNVLEGTWEWNGTAWTERDPQGVAPVARSRHAMAYEAKPGRTILFGGRDGSASHNDTWAWDGGAMTWTQLSPVNARADHAMAYDAERGQLILFGGYDGSYHNDTWAWDGTAWTELTPQRADDSPPARSRHAMAYDVERKHIVLFGGYRNGEELNDTWVWDGVAWQHVNRDGDAPSIRANHAMSYDANCQCMVLFGGYGYLGDSKQRVNFNDTWLWNGTAWSQAVGDQSDSPAARRWHAMAYDVARQHTVLFGGLGDEGASFNDTWAWDGATWTELVIAEDDRPARRRNHVMAYRDKSDQIVLFGGYGSDGDFDDTWVWDGVAWKRPPGTPPPKRTSHAMAYDPGRDRMVLFGGTGTNTNNGGSDSAYLGDTWEWDGQAWSSKLPTYRAPSPRYSHAMVSDTLHDRIVLFGGHTLNTYFNDTWIWNGEQWQQPPDSENLPPDARARHAMAYDASRDRIVLFGGSNGKIFNDTWEWNGSEWNKITDITGTMPPARENHTMVYDAAYRRVVLFGGQDDDDERLKDIWSWDGKVWEQLATEGTGPGDRANYAMAYDSTHARTILVGDGTWQLRYQQDRYSETRHDDEYCRYGFDTDGDGLIGCDDADCWRYCTPFCMPAATCNDSLPRCDDGICNPDLETHRMCPQDCAPPPTACGDFYCAADESRASCPADCS